MKFSENVLFTIPAMMAAIFAGMGFGIYAFCALALSLGAVGAGLDIAIGAIREGKK